MLLKLNLQRFVSGPASFAIVTSDGTQVCYISSDGDSTLSFSGKVLTITAKGDFLMSVKTTNSTYVDSYTTGSAKVLTITMKQEIASLSATTATGLENITIAFATAPSGETWVLNENLSASQLYNFNFTFGFVSNNIHFKETQSINDGDRLNYIKDDNSKVIAFDYSFTDNAYRTLVLDNPATGDLLTWLQANATKQGSTTATIESGTYVFNINLDTPTPNGFTQNLSFTSDGVTYSLIKYITSDPLNEGLYFGNTRVYEAGGWNIVSNRTIQVPTNQEVSADFKTWFDSNTTKQTTPTYSFKHWKKSNVQVNRTLVGEKYYYFKPYTILGLYTITTTLTNCTGASANATKIQENGGLTLTFTANNGYELPTGVSVTNVTSYNWNKSTGVLAISKPTGDVAIEIVAVSALPQLSTPTNVAVTDTTLTFDEVANATSYEVFVDNVSIGTHTIPSVISLKWKFNGTKAFIPQMSYDNSFEIDYDVYNNDTLVESNLSHVYFNDNYTYMTFGSSGYWDTTNNKYGGGNIILFKTEPSGFLLQFLQEHCEALN